MKYSRFVFIIIISLLVTGCSLSLAADVTPPPGAEISAAVPTQSDRIDTLVYPLVPPDPTSGAVIYAEKCASCHGDLGKGDGERANELPNPVPALSSLDIARQSAPSYWFSIIKNGNLERFMPPFPNLSDRQIWDTIAYLYQLSGTEESQQLGQQVFQDNCSRCHGNQAKGDGIDAASLSTSPTNLADLAFMSGESARDLFQSISFGITPDMPAFSSRLSEDERWAVTDYLRSLTNTSIVVVDATPTTEITQTVTSEEVTVTPVVTITAETGSITGSVMNGSDSDSTAQLAVTLYGYDDTVQVITETTKTRTDGSFTFRNIELVEGRIFFATTEFADTTYGSDISIVSPDATTLDLPIIVYKTVTDSSIIKVDRLHLFFEMVDEQTVRVVELYIMSNTSNSTLIPESEGQPTIKFKLPVGSKNLQFQDSVIGDRYLETPDGFGDTMPVRPGSGNYQVLFAFEMPYNRKMELVQPMLLPVDAVVILVPEGTIRIKSDLLEDAGTRTVENTQYRMYSGSGLNVGQDLQLIVTGNLAGSPSFGLGDNATLAIGLGVFGFSLILVGLWFYWQSRREARMDKEIVFDTPAESADAIMDAILALDDIFQAGEIPEAAYQQRRLELKNRLRALTEQINRDNLS